MKREYPKTAMVLTIFGMIVTVAAILFPFAAPTKPAVAGELTLLYTAGTGGKLKDCGCPGDPYGGLSERVTLIRDIRKQHSDILLLDAGNMVDLFGDYDLKAASVLRIMNMMDYDAAAVGRNEIYRGAYRVNAMKKTAKFPLLSASLTIPGAEDFLFEPYTILRRNDITVAVTSVLDSTCYLNNDPKDCDFGLMLPGERFRGLIREMEDKSDLVVVLSQMQTEANRKLLADIPAIDILIEGYGNKSLGEPEVVGNSLIFASGSRSQFVGKARIAVENGSARLIDNDLIPMLNIPEDSRAHDVIVEYYQNRK